ncbi:WD40-repeat-containing domain protein [Triangularia setosa]|uniref:WD40-repeat-containing domain protein n=1 Tax=Triangularia setosa TaxID=2587417 RepID=A0AAN7A633_9PEZI|nr:WD40-repeat-containing domain protein [Podospora setosa]
MTTSIWSTIKAVAPTRTRAPEHQHQHQHSESEPSPIPPVRGVTNRASSLSRSRVLGTPPPRSASISGEIRGSNSNQQSRSSPIPSPGAANTLTTQPLGTSKRTSSRLSRSYTSIGLNGKEKEKEKEVDHENAEDTGEQTTVAGNGTAGPGITIGVNPSAHTPSPIPSPALDPLSQQIYLRRNSEHPIPGRRSMHMAEGLARSSSDFLRAVTPAGDASKDKSKKGGSFLSRLSMRGGRKKDAGDLDSDSEFGVEARMDGTNARVFSQTLSNPVMGGGYVPHHKEPPRYIRTKATNKKAREFNRMFLAQELVGTRPPKDEEKADGNKAPVVTVSVAGGGDRKTARSGGAIWATEFSRDGKYLATGGRDHIVRIWAVLTTSEERRAHEDDESVNGGPGERLSAPVFRDRPLMEFEGHTGEVLDLSWSKNNFLLSSSMDKTVRLWHLSRKECICTFKHKDFVTRLAFHPRDDRFFLAGSLDAMLRLWSIPDKAVAFSANLPDLITAVAFSPDGKIAIAGLLNGLCVFFETEGLKQQTQIHVRSSRGKNAKGSKITGIQTMLVHPPAPAYPSHHPPGSSAASHASTDMPSNAEVRVLVTSNDSRIRIYSLRDQSMEVKFKGHENSYSQIAATFSDDGKYVICGSEDRKAFVWSVTGNGVPLTTDKDKSPCEYFEAHGEIVTTALFAPTQTRMLLGQSGDPIYDLCNPPPVVLQSLDEVASAAASTTGSHVPPPSEYTAKRPEPSPAYIARSTHYDGNILITTGDTGIIKVFRQDCAFAKRRHESWETGSTFSRKLAPNGGFISGNGLGRSGSVMTRTSGGSVTRSRRGSFTQPFSPQLGPIGGSSDRILSWRQGIENGGDKRSSALLNGNTTPAASERSMSPAKINRTPLSSQVNLASEARKQPYANSTVTTRNRAGSTLTSPTASVFSNAPSHVPSRLLRERRMSKEPEELSVPPTPSFTYMSASENEPPDSPTGTGVGPGGGSTTSSFWNLNRWRGITAFKVNASSSGQSGSGVDGHKRSDSRSSLTKRNPSNPGPDDEKEEGNSEQPAGTSRRQSTGMGLLPAASVVRNSTDGDGKDMKNKRMSPPASAFLDQADSEFDVPANEVMMPPVNPLQVRRDGSPYRHLWSRRTSSHASGGRPNLDVDG